MPNFTAGTSFTDGVTNDVTAAKLNALVADAVPTSSLALASTTGTISNFTASTANITLGTIPTLTAGTTTGTAGIFTSGTITTALIPTGTFGTTTSTAATITTGTIPTLVATTLITTGTGTAAAPAIVPTGDTNTGIFFPAADTIAFSEGGTEAMRIDSSGRVGIGTTSPQEELQINATEPTIRLEENGAGSKRLELSINSSAEAKIFANQSGGQLLLGTVGTERLRIDSSGRVGIGTSSPSVAYRASLTGDGSTITGGLALSTNSNVTYVSAPSATSADFEIWNSANGYVRFGTNNTERLRIDSSGNVGIGVTGNSNYRTTIKGNSSGINTGIYFSNPAGNTFELSEASNNTSDIQLWNYSNGYLRIGTNNTERLRIDSSGNLLVGHTNSTSLSGNAWRTMIEGANCLSVKNTNTSGATTAGFSASNYSGSVNILNFYRGDGTTVVGTISMSNGLSGTSVAYNTSSDYRLKINLEPISNGIERLKQLPVYRFNWVADENGNKVDGFVAHEAQAIVPECVTGEKDAVDADGKPIYQGIDQSKIVPLLTAALKEAIAKIETLEAKMTALEAA